MLIDKKISSEIDNLFRSSLSRMVSSGQIRSFPCRIDIKTLLGKKRLRETVFREAIDFMSWLQLSNPHRASFNDGEIHFEMDLMKFTMNSDQCRLFNVEFPKLFIRQDKENMLSS